MPVRGDYPQPCHLEGKFDWDNMLASDPRDPRSLGEGPCGLGHSPERKYRTNRWCAWLTCSRCALRLTYAPAKDAPTNSIAMGPTPETVRKALGELGDPPTANMMRGLIRKHQGEKQASTPAAGPAGSCQEEARAHTEPMAGSKGRPSGSQRRNAPVTRPSPADPSAPGPRASPQVTVPEPEDIEEDNKNVDRWEILIRKALRLQATLGSMVMVGPRL